MAFFNQLKGAYPGLTQIDKTLPIGSGSTGIVRGSLLYVDASGAQPVFRLAGAAQSTDPKAYIYIALMGQDDSVAGMAGTIGQGSASGVPAITGLAIGMPMEFQTDQFDATQSYNVGDYVTVGANGRLVPHTSGKNVLGQVTVAVTTRWVNNAVAVAGYRTGAEVSILTVRSLWIPVLTIGGGSGG